MSNTRWGVFILRCQVLGWNILFVAGSWKRHFESIGLCYIFGGGGGVSSSLSVGERYLACGRQENVTLILVVERKVMV